MLINYIVLFIAYLLFNGYSLFIIAFFFLYWESTFFFIDLWDFPEFMFEFDFLCY